jgi:hypothetical protein
MSHSIMGFTRSILQKTIRTPFMRLVRLFVGRAFHGSGDSGEGELGFSVGLVLSLLPLPGGFYSIFLLEKYSTLLQWMRGQRMSDSLAEAIPDEYFFIVLSMVVTAAVALWRWDSIFPDRRDYANLVPLPISTRNIFLANVAAILFLALVLALDVNAVSALIFPVAISASVDSFSFFAQFLVVHVVIVLLASIFSFFLVFFTIGMLMVVLPYRAFRKISLYLRSAMMGALIALLATSFVVPSLLNHTPKNLVRFLPPTWFLGLCQLLRGRASPALALLGYQALIGLAITVVGALVAYAISYYTSFKRIPETSDIISANQGTGLSWFFRLLDQTVLISKFQRGGYRFAMKTLMRSEHHGLVLGAFFGLGIVTASQFLFAAFRGKEVQAGHLPSFEILAVPLVLSYCMIVGIRLAFELPAELRANWIFRLSLDKSKHECIPLAVKIMLTFIVPWVLGILFPVYGYLWGWRVGLLQSIVVTLWSLLLGEFLLLKFRKVPFTCSYPPFRNSALVMALSYVLGFFVFVILTSKLEHWALVNPAAMVCFVVFPLTTWYVLSRLRQDIPAVDKELIFEENAGTGFELLDLKRGG